jgi:ethanolamine kinase
MPDVKPEHNDDKQHTTMPPVAPPPSKPPPAPHLVATGINPQELSIEHNANAEVATVCRTLVKGWMVADGGPASLEITSLSGSTRPGSQSWRVEAQPATWCEGATGNRVCAVLVRRYDDILSTLLIDRERDAAVLQALFQQKESSFKTLTPMLGTFANGRIEGWLDGWDALSLHQMHDQRVSDAVARLVARVHSVVPKGVKGLSVKEPELWQQLAAWLKAVGEVNFDSDKDKAAALGRVGLKDLLEESLQLQKNWEYFVAVSTEPSHIVFSHNDLLPSKIMTNSKIAESDADWPRLTAVDFEYSGYNMRAFDIANHFNAWAGLGCDWDALPSETTQKAFIRAYLGKVGGWPAEAEALHKEVQLLQLASNVYWGVWGVLQAKHGSSGDTTKEIPWLQFAQRQVARFRAEKERVYALTEVKAGADHGGAEGKVDAIGDTKSFGKQDAKSEGKHDATARKIDRGLGHDL